MKRDSQRGSVLLAVVLALSLIGAVALLLNRGTTMNLQSSAGQETADVARAAAEAALNHAIWQAQQSNCVNYVNFSDEPFGSTGYQNAFSPVYTTSVTPLSGSPVLVKAKGVLQNNGTTRELSRRVRVYEPSTTVTLQLGIDPGKDAMLDSWYNTRNYGQNYGGISTTSSQLQHQLYQFDLSDIPSGVKILAAHLEAFSYFISSSGPADFINLHRMTRDWLEGTKKGGGQPDGATWDTYDGVNPWTAPGGDFDPVALASAPVLTTNDQWFSWSIIPLVSQWLEQPASNMGVLLKGTGNFWVELASTEYNVPAQRPKLTITYACECGSGGVNGILTLQPDGAGGEDTHIHANQVNNNFGDNDRVYLTNKQSKKINGLFRFDLSTLPAAAIVSGASLELNLEDVSSMTAGTVTVHRLTQGWNESQATWNEYLTGSNWALPGGDYDPVAVTSTFVDYAALGPYQWDIKPLVIDWQTGTFPNDGILLKISDGVDAAKFTSSDGVTATLRPKLTINYSCPCGVVCGGGGSVGPIAHWKLDETSGLTAMDSAGGHDGTLIMDQTWGVGQIDGGLSFDGFDDYISVPHAETLSLTGEMTFAAWINTLDTSGGYRCILATDVPGNGASNYWFGISNDELVFGFWEAGSFRTVSTPSSNLQADRWYHLAASFDDATDEVRLYIDGGEAHVGAITFAPTTETADVWIGHSVDGEYWTGSLDDIRIYNTVLSAAEILALAKETGGPQTLTLAASADTWIEQASGVNYGADDWSQTGKDVSQDLKRSMIKFDVSSIPAGATVVSATLRLYVVNKLGQNDNNIGMYFIVTDWEENIVTWISSGGGGYDPASLAEPLIEWTDGWKEWDVPPGLIHEWIDGVTPNYGLLLDFLGTKKNHVLRFVTKEYADLALRPQLVIEYTEP